MDIKRENVLDMLKQCSNICSDIVHYTNTECVILYSPTFI